MAHHIDGPSSLPRRNACPASHNEELAVLEKFPEAADRETEWSKDGEEKHALIASAVKERKEPEDDDLKYAYDIVISDMDTNPGETYEIVSEKEMPLAFDRFGTPDLVVYPQSIDVANVYEFKFGHTRVPNAEYNWQIKDYMLGLLDKGLESVCGKVIQPPLNSVSQYVESSEYSHTIRNGIKSILDRCHSENPAHVPGEHCKYCLARVFGTCHVYQTPALYFPRDISVEEYVKTLGPAEASKLYKTMGLALDWFSEGIKTMERMFMADEIRMEGFRKGMGREGNRTWKRPADAAATLRALAENNNIDTSKLFNMKTPKQVETVLKKVEGIDSEIAKLVTRPPGKRKMMEDE